MSHQRALGALLTGFVLAACSSSNEVEGSPDAFVADGSEVDASTSYDTPTGDPATGKWSDLDGRSAPPHDPPTPTNTSVTGGGTMTFQHIGAPGYFGRRIVADEGDPRCDVEAKWIDYSWGGREFCCRTKHEITSDKITPFDDQISMVLDGPLRIQQLVVYQPLGKPDGSWAIRSFWDRRTPDGAFNFKFSGPKKDSKFTGDLGNSCTAFAMQEHPFKCGPGSDPYCPGSDLDFDGWSGSKLIILLASMPYADDPEWKVPSCNGPGKDERQEDSPWIGVAPSELDRDGWSGYHPCHCFANTNPGVGDGCGQINVFEVVAEASGPKWGNRDIISSGIRSYQVGSLGGAVCGIAGCTMDHFPKDADLLDANALKALTTGATIDADHVASATGPVWRRPLDDRYFGILLDEPTRTVQIVMIHPKSIPTEVKPMLPALPNVVPRSVIDAVQSLRLPK